MKRLLSSAEPLLSAAELAETYRLAADFEYGGAGERLQAQLIANDQLRYSSYISQPWFEMYLIDRAPLLLNYNPALCFHDDPGAAGSQVGRAARLVHASMTFLRTLETGNLEPDIFHTEPKKSKTGAFEELVRLLPRSVSFYGAAAVGAYPLDMSQYANLFRSTRLPGAERDALQTYAGSRHVMVQRGGSFFEVEVLDADGGTLPLAHIRWQLQQIVDAPDEAKPDEAVGLLTSLPRHEWAAARAQLGAVSEANRAALHAIDSAIFCVSLTHGAPSSLHDVQRNALHGGGADRWLDKSFQLVVTENAKAAVNFEHAWGDGVAVLRYFNEVYAASRALPPDSTAERPAAAAAAPRRLALEVPPAVRAAVTKARASFDAAIASTELATLESDAFSSGLLKQHRVSPDGMLQMSFQLAHYRMHGHSASTYESASTAAFKHGRTETIRSCTPLSHAFAQAFCTEGSTPSERAAKMRAAVANHSRVTRDALTGNGMDRHLFALRKLAEAEGAVPRLFTGAAMAKLNKIILSTSTLSSDALENGGFGPVNDECYAIGYGINAGGMRAQAMSYGRDSQGFIDCLERGMHDMREMLKVDTGDA